VHLVPDTPGHDPRLLPPQFPSGRRRAVSGRSLRNARAWHDTRPGLGPRELADIRLSPGTKELPLPAEQLEQLEQQRDWTSMRRLRRTGPDRSTANLLPYREAGIFRLRYNDQRQTRDEVTREQLVEALHRFYGDDCYR
jgi:hypothetical protein